MKRSCRDAAGREEALPAGRLAEERCAGWGRFVILWHALPPTSSRPSHFDLMFEEDAGLRTWAVERLPAPDGPAVRAVPLPPHRLAYLNYEGPVSQNRGHVCRVAAGHYQAVASSADFCFQLVASEAKEAFSLPGLRSHRRLAAPQEPQSPRPGPLFCFRRDPQFCEEDAWCVAWESLGKRGGEESEAS